MSSENSPDPDADRTRITASDADKTRIAAAPQDQKPGEGGAAGQGDRTQIATPTLRDAPHEAVQQGSLINNNYRVQAMLSQGGMGEVYRAENVYTGDPVAVKIVLPGLARDENIIALFKREARILGQLSDDALVRYHNFVLDQGLGRYCLIMEYIDGTTLWDHVDAHGAIKAGDALRLMARLARGLGKAHDRGVIHRDLSPDNVMLRGDDLNDPVVIDFGIARAADMAEGGLAGRFAGKFKYISPEQLGHFGGEIGPRADIYGMALMIAAVLRGDALPMGGSAEEAAQARRTIPDLTGLPHEAYPLLQYMLEPDPAARPASMAAIEEMAADPTRIPLRYRHPLWGEQLQGALPQTPARQGSGLLTGSLGSAPESDSPFGAPAEQAVERVVPAAKPRRRLGMLAALALGLVVICAAVFTLWPSTPEPVAVTSGLGDTDDDPAVPLPGRDETTREGFLAAFPLGECQQVQRIASGLDAGKLVALSAAAVDLDALLTQYDQTFGARPAVGAHQVTIPQCPALDFVRTLQGRAEPAPVLSLDSDRMISGGAIAGRLREARGRPIWLALIDADGKVHDLSSRLQPQADGSFLFSFGMSVPDPSAPAPQLIVALASQQALVTLAAAAPGASSADLLPEVLAEIRDGDGLAAADIASFTLDPPLSSNGSDTNPDQDG